MNLEFYSVEISGIAPIIFHNKRLANPLGEYTKRIKEITGKRKKTDADLLELQRLEFLGSLYTNDTGPYIPSTYFERTLIKGMYHTNRKLYSVVKGGFSVQEDEIPLQYNGPINSDELWESGKFHQLDIVNVQNNKILRCRPRFATPWSVGFTILFEPSLLNASDLKEALSYAGMVIGVGDYRPKYGRFSVEKFQKIKRGNA